MSDDDTTNTGKRAFGDWLRARARALGIVDEQGNATAEVLAERFKLRGIAVKPRTVQAWFVGERAPRIGTMELVLDDLAVHGEDRAIAYSLAARVEQGDPTADAA